MGLEDLAPSQWPLLDEVPVPVSPQECAELAVDICWRETQVQAAASAITVQREEQQEHQL